VAINYPLDIPTNGIEKMTLAFNSTTAMTQSPTSGAQQVQEFANQLWTASINVGSALTTTQVDEWKTFLISLFGRKGTFLMGDPMRPNPRGLAYQNVGNPVVYGAGQTGTILKISGCPANVTNYLVKGDYLQISTSTATRLHIVLNNVNIDSSGRATIDLAPRIRTAPANGQTIILNNCKGQWRLTQDIISWDMEGVESYGISFDAVEALS
jgi:hypothetical protein